MKLNEADIKKIQDYFATQKDVVAVYLYGSFYKETTHSRSDIDIAVLFEDKVDYHRLGQISSDLSAFKLPAEPEVRDINLNLSPVFLLNVIQGKLIFTSDEKKKNVFEVAVLRQYYDTQHLRDIKYYYMQKRLQEGTYGY